MCVCVCVCVCIMYIQSSVNDVNLVLENNRSLQKWLLFASNTLHRHSSSRNRYAM